MPLYRDKATDLLSIQGRGGIKKTVEAFVGMLSKSWFSGCRSPCRNSGEKADATRPSPGGIRKTGQSEAGAISLISSLAADRRSIATPKRLCKGRFAPFHNGQISHRTMSSMVAEDQVADRRRTVDTPTSRRCVGQQSPSGPTAKHSRILIPKR